MKKLVKPRLLMICTLPPPVHGSAMVSQYIRESKVLNDAFKMDFVNLSTSRSINEIGKTGFKYTIIKLWRLMSSLLRCLYLLIIHRYNACYCAITCHGSGFLKDAPFVLLCRLFNRKVIIHQHNKGMANDSDKPFYKRLFHLAYRNTTVILLSWRLYPDIKNVVNKDQIRVCPNGIPDINERYLLNKSTVPQLLFLSNLIESKGVFTILDACKILKDKGYVFKCHFVGGESKAIDANRFTKEVNNRNLENIVEYRGCKYGSEKIKEFESSDIFVFPSYDDCFPLVLLEAMQMALPIITSHVGGIPEIVVENENGYIIAPNSPQDLADKIKNLFDNPDYAHFLGQNGQKRYNKFFTIKVWENNLKYILDEAIK